MQARGAGYGGLGFGHARGGDAIFPAKNRVVLNKAGYYLRSTKKAPPRHGCYRWKPLRRKNTYFKENFGYWMGGRC